MTFSLAEILLIGRIRMGSGKGSPYTPAGKSFFTQALRSAAVKFGKQPPPLDPITEMGIKDPNFAKLTTRITRLKQSVAENEVEKGTNPQLVADLAKFEEKLQLERRLSEKREELSRILKTVLTDDLKQMMRVLRRLDFIDNDNIVLRKGRVACEISTTDENELLLTELLFKGTLNDMETEMIVALLSCLVNVHKAPDNFSLPEEFKGPLQDLNEVVARIATVSLESGIKADSGPSADKVQPSLMEVSYQWAKGAKFSEVIKTTTAYEGDIVRMMRRLEEMMRQLAGAAKSPAIGSIALHDKFLDGIQKIKRDIVFAGSLYT
jgi:ATP-dependent RNA helicase DOB1